MRWIWIDRFVEFEHGKSARAIKNLSLAEDYFADHFPGCPVMPASLILEGLAQTGGILVGEANQFREKVVLAKVNRAVFHREHLPGEIDLARFDAGDIDNRNDAPDHDRELHHPELFQFLWVERPVSCAKINGGLLDQADADARTHGLITDGVAGFRLVRVDPFRHHGRNKR